MAGGSRASPRLVDQSLRFHAQVSARDDYFREAKSVFPCHAVRENEQPRLRGGIGSARASQKFDRRHALAEEESSIPLLIPIHSAGVGGSSDDGAEISAHAANHRRV